MNIDRRRTPAFFAGEELNLIRRNTMREKLQTLPLSELKEMAKSRGIKGISSLRKAEIIDLLCDEAEKNPDIKPAEIKREVKTETLISSQLC